MGRGLVVSTHVYLCRKTLQELTELGFTRDETLSTWLTGRDYRFSWITLPPL